jgi:acetolactate synthase-1/2/3 large subunit
MHLNDSLGRHPSLKYICNLHEQASAVAAEAYGQYSGLGVAIVTSGPGGTNALTGVAGAWLESTPMLVISGQVKRADLVGARGVRQIGFQEIDIVQMAKPVTKYAVTVLEPSQIRYCMERAAWVATHGRRGPVWVDIPLDVQAAEVDPPTLPAFVPPAPGDATGLVERTADRTMDYLSHAKRPAVLVGNGVRSAGAVSLFIRWIEKIGIPVLTTWKALDYLPDGHALYIGRPGLVGQRAANIVQQKCDLLICIGARLDYGQTAYNHANFASRAERIVVDIDPCEIAKLNMRLAAALTADAGDFLRAMLEPRLERTLPDWSGWRAHCKALKARYPVVLPSYRTAGKGVNNYVFVEALGGQLLEHDILVPGSSGACSEVTSQAVPNVRGMRFINTHGLGAMGFGVPAALGACLASGGRRTVCIDGDGGFPMNAQELGLIASLELPVKFFVLCNEGYGSIRATQNNYFDRRLVACSEATGLHLPEPGKLAAAFGIPSHRIENHEELEAQLTAIMGAPGPAICSVIMAPDQATQPRVTSRQLPGGGMETMPMEDMWPFLERGAFHAVMAE